MKQNHRKLLADYSKEIIICSKHSFGTNVLTICEQNNINKQKNGLDKENEKNMVYTLLSFGFSQQFEEKIIKKRIINFINIIYNSFFIIFKYENNILICYL